MKFSSVLVAASLALSLIACGDPYNGDATILEHEYVGANDVWVPGRYYPGYCSPWNNTFSCTPDYYSQPHWRHEPERFLLHVEWVDEDGKRHTDEYETNEHTYLECPDGRVINLKSMQCPLR